MNIVIEMIVGKRTKKSGQVVGLSKKDKRNLEALVRKVGMAEILDHLGFMIDQAVSCKDGSHDMTQHEEQFAEGIGNRLDAIVMDIVEEEGV